jgi:hypothetical protein
MGKKVWRIPDVPMNTKADVVMKQEMAKWNE